MSSETPVEREELVARVSLGKGFWKWWASPRDFLEALKRLAEQGDAEAQASLGVMHWKGTGVSEDLVQAYMWLDLAAAENQPAKIKIRDALAAKMTTQQIVEAQRLAREWKAKKG